MYKPPLTATTSTPFSASALDLGLETSRVIPRTANCDEALESPRMDSMTEPPWVPVAPNTVTTFFCVDMIVQSRTALIRSVNTAWHLAEMAGIQELEVVNVGQLWIKGRRHLILIYPLSSLSSSRTYVMAATPDIRLIDEGSVRIVPSMMNNHE